MRTRYSVLASVILGLAASSANAVSLYDYKEASSAYEDAYVTGAFNYDTNNNIKQTDGSDAKDTYKLLLNVDYSKVVSSPMRDFKFDAAANGSVSREIDGSTIRNYQGNASAEVRNYLRPNSKGVFVYGSAAVEDIKGQPDYYAALAAGVGYGRVVDVTPMSKAMRLVHKLRVQNKLSGDLTVSEYQRIADIIARKSEYPARHGRETYMQNWIGDIVQVLNTSGKTNGALDAAGVIKVSEVLDGGFLARKHGWLVKAGVDRVVKNYNQGRSDTGLQIGAEYHRPLSNTWQLSEEVSVSSNLKSTDKAYRLNNKLALSKEVSDRIIWENYWTANRSKYDNASANTNHLLGTSYQYHLTNVLDLTTGLEFSKNSGSKTDAALKTGLSYRLK